MQGTDTPCQQKVQSCGFFTDHTQDNWLITQYITRTVVDGGRRLPRVSANLQVTLWSYDDSSFIIKFTLYKYETSTEDSALARDITNYTPVRTVTRLQKNITTIQVDLNTESAGFYLAIRDQSRRLCLFIHHIVVLFNVCPRAVHLFIIRPETLAPSIETVITPPALSVDCIAGASPENGETAKLICLGGGVWRAIEGSGCRCNASFLAPGHGQSCIRRLINFNNVPVHFASETRS